MLNIYIANLGKYNEGILKGAWIELPIDEDELNEILADKVGINEQYEEWAIHDYETDWEIEINEYDDIYRLNDLAEQLDYLNEYDIKKLKAIHEYQGGNIEDCIDDIKNHFLHESIRTDHELGYFYVDTFYSDDFKDMSNLINYIDYEAFGRDVRHRKEGAHTSHGWIERC